MNKTHIESFLFDFIESEENRIPVEFAHSPKLAGMRMFDEPVIAYGSAIDERLSNLRSIPEAQVPLMPPSEWLPSARTVISCFFPIASEIRRSNRRGDGPSWEWLHARNEGNTALFALARRLCVFLAQRGYESLAPAQDERYFHTFTSASERPLYKTNWSERHVGFICGLGTFSLSKGLITKKGVAGRIFSVITSLELEPTIPTYSELFDHCINCRICVGLCPVDAIDEFHHKDDWLCKQKLDEIEALNPPYYSCGKCQVAVPCELRIPVSPRGR